MNNKEKVNFLETKSLNWLEIAEVLGTPYEQVRVLAQEESELL